MHMLRHLLGLQGLGLLQDGLDLVLGLKIEDLLDLICGDVINLVKDRQFLGAHEVDKVNHSLCVLIGNLRLKGIPSHSELCQIFGLLFRQILESRFVNFAVFLEVDRRNG